MWKLLLNGMVTGLIVVTVSEIARRWPRLGSLVLTLPIVIPAVFVVMYLRQRDLAPISRLAQETLILIPLGLPFFAPLAFAGRLGLGFWPALLSGFGLVTATVCAYLWMAPRM